MRALVCVLRINAWRVTCNFILHACNVKLHAFWCSVPCVFTPRVHEVVFELYCILSCHAWSHVDIILLAIMVSLYSCCMIVELVYCNVHYWLCGKMLCD